MSKYGFRLLAICLMLLSILLIIGSIDQITHNNVLINGMWLWVILLPLSILLFQLVNTIDKIDNQTHKIPHKTPYTKLSKRGIFEQKSVFRDVSDSFNPFLNTEKNITSKNKGE
jgi:hypothetical protein